MLLRKYSCFSSSQNIFHHPIELLLHGIVTAAGSFGYFVSPLFTRMSLVEYGWQDTLLFFSIFIVIGLGLAFLLTTPKTIEGRESEMTTNSNGSS